MARKKGKGTKLKVFSGREATLNYVIFLILYSKKLLTSYEMYSEIRSIKGCRHIKRQNVDRRLKALRQQHWLEINGKKPARAHFLQPLYQLSVRAQAALAISKKDLNDLLQTAPEDQLRKLIDALSICP